VPALIYAVTSICTALLLSDQTNKDIGLEANDGNA
jgi:hypothetical protein